jgi:carbonic anhydrase
MIGLEPGDAKILRNPGGRLTESSIEALILAVHLLGVNRIMIVPHTKCAVGTNTERELQDLVGKSAGQDATWQRFSVVADQIAALATDVEAVRSHPLIPEWVAVGGFLYDVDSGLLEQKF